MAKRALPTQADYEALIDQYIEARGAERDLTQAKIEKDFAVDTTILVLDISGFSRLTAQYGVIHYLAMVRRMQLMVTATIGRHDGAVLKFEADNLYATFASVDAALQFALDLKAGFDGMNVLTDDDSDIHVSIGVASGEVLLIENRDAWGAAMNLASRLGEDVAARGEILVCAESFAASAQESAYHFAPRSIDDKGRSVPIVAVGGRRY